MHKPSRVFPGWKEKIGKGRNLCAQKMEVKVSCFSSISCRFHWILTTFENVTKFFGSSNQGYDFSGLYPCTIIHTKPNQLWPKRMMYTISARISAEKECRKQLLLEQFPHHHPSNHPFWIVPQFPGLPPLVQKQEHFTRAQWAAQVRRLAGFWEWTAAAHPPPLAQSFGPQTRKRRAQNGSNRLAKDALTMMMNNNGENKRLRENSSTMGGCQQCAGNRLVWGFGCGETRLLLFWASGKAAGASCNGWKQ